ncbi:hypothetical protein CC80DRAFT_195049 [Byssothecium circinans]|uniref:Uncharacterized protein n=1 Tax=Byssothecium circinans TaxID=147558 RepID=A0A6A5U9R8_9PLEO|nr:hypothetical protein CC80DRAFT_195049 [Byssothecium circinans]
MESSSASRKRMPAPPPIEVPEPYLSHQIRPGPNAFAIREHEQREKEKRRERKQREKEERKERKRALQDSRIEALHEASTALINDICSGKVIPRALSEPASPNPQTATTTFTDLMKRAERASPEKSLHSMGSASAQIASRAHSTQPDDSTERLAAIKQKQYEQLFQPEKDPRTNRAKMEGPKEPKLFKFMNQVPDTPKDGKPAEVLIQKTDLRDRQSNMSKTSLATNASHRTPKKKLFGVSMPSFNLSSSVPKNVPPKAAQMLGTTDSASKARGKMAAGKFLGAFKTPRSNTASSLATKVHKSPPAAILPPKVFTPHTRTHRSRGSYSRTSFRGPGAAYRMGQRRAASPRKPIPFTPAQEAYKRSDDGVSAYMRRLDLAARTAREDLMSKQSTPLTPAHAADKRFDGTMLSHTPRADLPSSKRPILFALSPKTDVPFGGRQITDTERFGSHASKPPTPPEKDTPLFAGYRSGIEQVTGATHDANEEEQIDEENRTRAHRLKAPKMLDPNANVEDYPQFRPLPKKKIGLVTSGHAQLVAKTPLQSAYPAFDSVSSLSSTMSYRALEPLPPPGPVHDPGPRGSKGSESSSSYGETPEVSRRPSINGDCPSELHTPHERAPPPTPTSTKFSVGEQLEYLQSKACVPPKVAAAKKASEDSPELLRAAVYVPPAKDVTAPIKETSDGLQPTLLLPTIYVPPEKKKMGISMAQAEKEKESDSSGNVDKTNIKLDIKLAGTPRPSTAQSVRSAPATTENPLKAKEIRNPAPLRLETMDPPTVHSASSAPHREQAHGAHTTDMKPLHVRNNSQPCFRGGLQVEHSSSQLTDILNGVSPSRNSFYRFQPHCPSAVPSPLHRAPSQPSQDRAPTSVNGANGFGHTAMQRQFPVGMDPANGHGQNGVQQPQTSAATNTPSANMPTPGPPGSAGSVMSVRPDLNMNDHFYMTNAHIDTVAMYIHDHVAASSRADQTVISTKHDQLLTTLGQQFDDVKSHLNSVSEKADHSSNQTHNLSVQLDRLFEFVKTKVIESLQAQMEKSAGMEQSIKELQKSLSDLQKNSSFPSPQGLQPNFTSPNNRPHTSSNGFYGEAPSNLAGTPETRRYGNNGYWPRASPGTGREQGNPFAHSNPYNNSNNASYGSNGMAGGIPGYGYPQGSDQQYGGYPQGPSK